MTKSLRDHAAALLLVESEATTKLKEILDEAAEKIQAVVDGLDYPEGYPSNSRRIAQELLSGFDYRRNQELPHLLVQMNPINVENANA